MEDIDQKRLIVIDIETTGLKYEENHRIIEIGAIKLIDRKITDEQFHCYLNPNRQIDESAYRIHGISSDFLKDKPTFSEIFAEFMQYIGQDTLIAHNARFDINFINHEISLLGRSENLWQRGKVIDTLKIAQKLRSPSLRNTLDALCKEYGIDNSHRTLHGALLDAHLLAKIYLCLTGGQTQLFTTQRKNSESNTQIPLTRTYDLKIILANSYEIKEHEKFMQFLDSQE